MNAPIKILIVDDEEVVRRGFARTLAGDHCQVDVASDGAEAMRKMDRQAFDVLLLDLRMPGMDGMAVLRQVKTKWPEAEVIVITGYPALDTAKESVALGAYDYLAKPVGPDEVIKVTHGAIQHKRWALRREPAGRPEASA